MCAGGAIVIMVLLCVGVPWNDPGSFHQMFIYDAGQALTSLSIAMRIPELNDV
jgi:hypothetical protein